MRLVSYSSIVCLFTLSLFSGLTYSQSTAVQAPSSSTRSVAITFDDLPVVRGRNLKREQRITKKLLHQIAVDELPTIGFVIGSSLDSREKLALIEQWLEAGHDLGNHTYSHPNLRDTPLADYIEEVLRADLLLSRMLEKRDKEIQYFRHPYLNTGSDLSTKLAFEQFLLEQNYIVAPVTIDNDEYIYAAAYDQAESANEQALALRIAEDYVRYMEEIFAFYEQFSLDFLGREPAQILLLHSNALNSDYLGELTAMLKARGYQFISLAKALEDAAYKLPDKYVGRRGISWLMRWSITQGNETNEQPQAPYWIRKMTE